MTANASTPMLTPSATLSVTLLTTNANYAFDIHNATLVPAITSTPIVTLSVAPLVTPLVTLNSQFGDTNASRATQCACTAGYVCSCGFSRKLARPVNRSYVSERVVKMHRPASALMLKRFNPDLAHPDLLARVNTNKPCCSGMCLKMLWKGTRQPLTEVDLNSPSYHSGFGVKFLEAVMAARESVYHTSSYKSSVELKAILQRDVGMGKMTYKFYHRGVLGDSPTVPEGIEVMT
jgi:hypothetical protein